jgi:hypothetical protein
MRRRKSAWKAAVLALFFGGVALFYLDFRRGLVAVVAWCAAIALVSWIVAAVVSPANAFSVAFLITNALFIWPAVRISRLHNNKIPADLKIESDGSQRVKNVGHLVIGLSVFTGLVGLAQAGNPGIGELGRFIRATYLVSLPLAVWGSTTGIGLLRAWRWARFSMLVFSSLLVAFGMLFAVAFLFMPNDGEMSGWGVFLLKTFAVSLWLIPVGIGVRWLIYFRSHNVKAHFSV